MLENADNVVFASVADKRGQAAVARGVLTDGGLGVTAPPSTRPVDAAASAAI